MQDAVAATQVEHSHSCAIARLPADVLEDVVVFLEPREIMLDVAVLSRAFRDVVDGTLFWRSKYGKSLSLSPTVLQSLSKRQLQQCCLLAIARRNCSDSGWHSSERVASFPACVRPRSALLPRNDAMKLFDANRGRVCLSSTQDRAAERIENALSRQGTEDENWEAIMAGNPTGQRLSDLDLVQMAFAGDRWWSSSPSQQTQPEETNDVLLFTTKWREAIITDVAIKPLKEPILFGNGQNIFSWPKIMICVYRLPPESLVAFSSRVENTGPRSIAEYVNVITHETAGVDRESLYARSDRTEQRSIIESVLQGRAATYQSPVMDAKSSDEQWQSYKIPDGVVGNVVTFTLFGKNCEQFPGSGYYTCVERVAVRGVPLDQ